MLLEEAKDVRGICDDSAMPYVAFAFVLLSVLPDASVCVDQSLCEIEEYEKRRYGSGEDEQS